MKYMRRGCYSEEFKRQAVQRSIDSPQTVREVADTFGISAKMLTRWRQELTMGKKPKPVQNEGPEKSLKELERENRELKKRLERSELENEILKKAKEYFDKLPK